MKGYQIFLIVVLMVVGVGLAVYVLRSGGSISDEEVVRLSSNSATNRELLHGKGPLVRAGGESYSGLSSSGDTNEIASAVSRSAGIDEERIVDEVREKSIQEMLENIVKKSIDEGVALGSSGRSEGIGRSDGSKGSGRLGTLNKKEGGRETGRRGNNDLGGGFSKGKDGKKDWKRGEGIDRVSESEIKLMVEEAKRALDSGDYEKAKQLLEKTLELDPSAREALRAMGNLYKKMGNLNGEIDVYQRWIGANPGDPTPHYLLAEAYRRQGRYDLAYNELQVFEQMSGDRSSTYAMSAGMYRQLGMKDEEFRALMNWVNHDPNSQEARISLGDYYRRIGDYNSAIAQYQTAISLAPGNVNNYVAISSMYSKIGMYPQAEDYLYKAFQLQPNNSTVQILLAQNYIRQGDISSAIWMYQYILENNPDPAMRAQAERALQRLENQNARRNR